MTFCEEFLKCLPWRPFQAAKALYWQITRRRVRARNYLRRDVHLAPYAYEVWIEVVEKPDEAAALGRLATPASVSQPMFSILIDQTQVGNNVAIAASVSSVLSQTIPDWVLLLPHCCEGLTGIPSDHRIRILPAPEPGTSTFSQAVLRGEGRYLISLRAGDRLPVGALGHYLYSIVTESGPAVLFGDSDQLDSEEKRQSPWFKPSWNSEMFLAQDYLSDACSIDASLAVSAASLDINWPNSTPYSLLLAATSITARPVVHVPHILCHLTCREPAADIEQRVAAVSRHLAPMQAKVTAGPFGTARTQWPLPATLPLVSIIIPTRDKVDLLKACISSLTGWTEYPNFEVLVVDNQSEEAVTAEYLAELSALPNFRILSWDHPYNYAAINNFAVGHSNGSLICLLNNDTEIIESTWLTELVRYALRPHIGAVGAMLLYGDRTIQHAGVVIGMGQAAGHAHRYQPVDEPGYHAQAHIPRFASAVTAACLLVGRDKFDAVGGLDEAGFAIAFNDVDFCLKLQKAGWRNVYAPQAVLLHHESKSRGNDMTPANIDRYMRELGLLQERWGTRDYVDPLHHPRLDRANETYSINLRT